MEPKEFILQSIPELYRDRFCVSVETVETGVKYKLDVVNKGDPGIGERGTRDENMNWIKGFTEIFIDCLTYFKESGNYVSHFCKRPGKEFEFILKS